MEENTLEMTVMSIFFFVVLIAVFWKGRRDAKVLRQARIEDEDGTLRLLKQEEFSVLSQKIARGRSWYFWYIIIGGIILVVLSTLAVRFWLPSK